VKPVAKPANSNEERPALRIIDRERNEVIEIAGDPKQIVKLVATASLRVVRKLSLASSRGARSDHRHFFRRFLPNQPTSPRM
jgi:hypothetical protein